MNRGSIKVIVLGVLITVSYRAQAQAGGDEAPLRDVGAVNIPLLSDPAGSLGAQGTRLGLGATVHHRSQGLAAIFEDPRDRSGAGEVSASPGRITVPRFWLSQGLPIPMNLALSAGAAAELGIRQVTGALQGTLWEALGWPALAVRISDSRLFGPRETRVITRAVLAVVDWAPWSVVTVLGGYGLVRHSGSWRPQSQGDPSVAAPSGTWTEWGERVASLGIRWRWAPLVSLTGEMGWRGGQIDQWAVKWAVGL